MKKTKILLFLFIFLGLGLAASASAHNPRIVGNQETVRVLNPEISQAFYGVLQGAGQWFEINSDKDFTLYVNLLVPKINGVNTKLLFEIYKKENGEQNLIANLDGENFSWSEFYEPFGGDTYLKGPEFKAEVLKGDYQIRVTHCHADEPAGADEASCAFSKYVLVVGEKESFPPKEILNAIYLLPTLKKDFFNRSPLTAYFNYSGLFMLGSLIILAGIIFVIVKIIKRIKKRKNLETRFKI